MDIDVRRKDEVFGWAMSLRRRIVLASFLVQSGCFNPDPLDASETSATDTASTEGLGAESDGHSIGSDTSATDSGSVETTDTDDGETAGPLDGHHIIPGRIEAEDYRDGGQGVGYFDKTDGNTWGGCQADDDVDIKPDIGEGNSCVVGEFEAGEWLAYNVWVEKDGIYQAQLRVARGEESPGRVHLEVDGIDVSGPIEIPKTGVWDPLTFVIVTVPNLNLTAGSHVLVLEAEVDWVDLDWLEFFSRPSDEIRAPEPPDLDVSNAIEVGCDDDLAAMAEQAPNATFYLPNCTYTNVFEVTPSDGQRFIGESEDGVILQGNSGINRAFTGNASHVVIANMTLRGYGSGTDQSEAVIAGNTRYSSSGSDAIADDWHIYRVTIEDSGNGGLFLGNRWIVQECSFLRNNPTGVGGSRGVGGWIADSYFADNGTDGATGSADNAAQLKIVWWNVGPFGDPDRDSSPWVNFEGNDIADQTETPERLRVTGSTFDGGGDVRGVWFDLDVRDTEVAYNTFNQARTFGVFYEGCNNGWIHHNEFNGSGEWWGAPRSSAYFSASAVATNCSDNITVENNTFNDCPGSLVFYLGERGRNGADWVTDYPVATPDWGGASNPGQGYMIVNSFDPIGPTDRSSVGSSHLIARNNTFTGSSRYVGYMLDSEIDPNTEANMNTIMFNGNTYPSGQTEGTTFVWGHNTQSYADWQAAGRQ